MIRRGVTYGLCLAAVAACAPVPQQDTDGGGLKGLEALPSVIVHEPSPRVRLEGAIDAYRALLDSHPGPDLRAAVLRRLADLQLELAEARLAAAQPDADAAYHAAVSNYLKLLELFPDDARSDEVRYQLARAYDALGRPQRVLAMLNRLVAAHPDSRLVAEAHFRRGEILFNRQAYAAAESAYRAVVAHEALTAFHEQALYKLGWSLLKQDRYADAVDMFVRGLDTKLTERTVEEGVAALPRAERELVDDSLRAVALAFAAMQGPNAVVDYWASRGGRPYGHLVYRALGELYQRRGRLFDASELYEDFVERHPMHPEAPRFNIELYRLYDRLGFTSQAWGAREDFVRRYRLDGAFWQDRSVERFPAVVESLRETMAELARRSHARWQSSGRDRDIEETIGLYRDYLRQFPDAARAPDLRFLLAELLYEHGDHVRAAQEYERFAYTYPAHRNAADAAYTALLAYEKLTGGADGADDAAEWRSRFVESAFSYATRFPRHPQVATVLARVAGELFELGAYPRARVAARRVTGGLPSAGREDRRTAWRIIGHIDFDGGDYRGAESAYREALALTPVGHAQRPALVEKLAAAVYRQGERALGRDRVDEAVGHFLRVRTAALLRAQEWERATQVLERFRATYGDHELVPEATRKLAAAYLNSGRLAPAAEEFERMARASTEPGRGQEALWRAGELYEQAGRAQSAARAYKRYLAGYEPALGRALEVRFRLARLAETRGDDARRRYWLNEIIVVEGRAGAARSDASRAAAAEASLALARPLREAYAAIKLSVPLEQSLERKKRALERALEAYGQAAETGIARVTTAATYHISELYHDFSRALLDSERPQDLSAEELMEYNVLLEEQAYPFEERAIELHETNWRRVGEGIYDRWVKASLARLAELLPARYGKTEKRAHVIEQID